MAKSSEVNVFRVPITMPEELVAYLNQLSVKAKMSGGKKLPSTMIVRAAMQAIKGTNLDVSGVRTEELLVKRIEEAFEEKCIKAVVRMRSRKKRE